MMKKAVVLLLVIMSLCICSCTKDNTVSEHNSSEPVSSSQTSSPKPNLNVSSKDNTLWERKMVAITFDDSPQETNGDLLDLLKEKDVKCTFFLQGNNIEKHPDFVKRMVNEGHTIGWHSYDHSRADNSVASPYLDNDFAKIQPILNNIGLGDYKMRYVRWPGGNYNDDVREVSAQYGMSVINWSNYSFNDSTNSYISAEDRVKPVFEDSNSFVTNGTVFLIHPRDDAEIIKGIGLLIDKLKAQGYEVVNIEELMKRRNGGNPGQCYGTAIY